MQVEETVGISPLLLYIAEELRGPHERSSHKRPRGLHESETQCAPCRCDAICTYIYHACAWHVHVHVHVHVCACACACCTYCTTATHFAAALSAGPMRHGPPWPVRRPWNHGSRKTERSSHRSEVLTSEGLRTSIVWLVSAKPHSLSV